MSLQTVMAEQRALREEMQRISQRLNENERMIEMLCRGAPADEFAAPQRPATAFNPRTSNGGYGGGYPTPKSPVQQRGFDMTQHPTMSRSMQIPANERTVLSQKKQVEKALDVTPELNAWDEPKDPKMSTSAIDNCERLLRQAFERYQQVKPSRSASPISAMQALLRQIDRNQSGQIGIDEFKQICKTLSFSATESTLEGLFRRYDMDCTGYVSAEEFGRLLLKPEGDYVSKAKSAIARCREVLSYRAGGFPALQNMYRQFRIADRDRSGHLSREEFNIAMDTFFAYYKVTFTPAEKNSLFAFFDRENSDSISYDEWIRAIRGEMNEFRANWVKQAFSILDQNGSGTITVDEIMTHYNVSDNPGVKTGKVTPQAAFKVFMNSQDINEDGTITFEEFMESYQWVSASIDHDNYFELMMRNAWHIHGGEGVCENTASRRVLVQHMDGSCEVVEIINDLGLDLYDQRAVIKRLTEQGVRNIKKIELYS